MSKIQQLRVVGVAVLVLLLAACATHETRYTVDMIESNSYSPASLVVPRGSTVAWHNKDHEVHSTIADPELALHPEQMVSLEQVQWDSGDVTPGGVWMRTFDTPGTYLFFCRYRDEMVGTITVTE